MIISKKLFTNGETPHSKAKNVSDWGNDLREAFEGPLKNEVMAIAKKTVAAKGLSDDMESPLSWTSKRFTGEFGVLDEVFWKGVFPTSLAVENRKQHSSYYGGLPLNTKTVTYFDKRKSESLLKQLIAERIESRSGIKLADLNTDSYLDFFFEVFEKGAIYPRTIWFLHGVNEYLQSDFQGTLKDFLENEDTYGAITSQYNLMALRNYPHTGSMVSTFAHNDIGSLSYNLNGAAFDATVDMSRDQWNKLLQINSKKKTLWDYSTCTSNTIIAKIGELGQNKTISLNQAINIYEESLSKAIFFAGAEMNDDERNIFPSIFVATKWISNTAPTFNADFPYKLQLKTVSENIVEIAKELTPKDLAIFTFCVANPKAWVRSPTQGDFWLILERAAKEGCLGDLIQVMRDYALGASSKVPTIIEWNKAIESDSLMLGGALISTLIIRESARDRYESQAIKELKRDLRIK